MLPDLMCAEPAVRIDVHALRTALVFTFAAGGAPEVFDELIQKLSHTEANAGQPKAA